MAGYDTLGTSLVINDGMSKVLKNIINTTNMLVQSFGNMQNHARTNIPTNIGDNIRNSIVRAENELRNYERTLNQISGRSINNTIHTNIANLPSMQNPVQPLDNMSNWNRLQGINIFNTTGTERLQKEMNDYRNMVNGISNIQDKLKNNIGLMDKSLLPQNAISDITHAENRVNSLIQSMQKLSNADMAKLNTSQVESMNNSFESMRQNASSMINVMSNLNTSISSGNINGLNSGFNQLNNLVEQAERQIRNTGQALNEINSANSAANGMAHLQQTFENYKRSMEDINRMKESFSTSSFHELIPKDSLANVTRAEGLLNSLASTMQRMSGRGMELLNPSQVESMQNSFETLRRSAETIQTTMSGIRTNINAGNLENVNAGFFQLGNLAAQATREIRTTNQALNAMTSPHWQSITGGQELFTSTGILRTTQEMNSLYQMFQKLRQSQDQISQNSAKMSILPPNASQDFNLLNSRILNINNTIRMLEMQKSRLSRFDISGINNFNNRIESLRGQLNSALTAQQNINRAIDSNNLDRMNQSARELHNILNDVGRQIRDNNDQQRQFSSGTAQPKSGFNDLLSTGKMFGMALANNIVNSAKQVIDSSIDKIIQVTEDSFKNGLILIKSERELQARLGNDRAGTTLYKILAQDAKTSVFDESQMLKVSSGFLPYVKSTNQLKDLNRITEILSLFDKTGQGADGASFALRELIGGSATSMARRFDVSPNFLRSFELDKLGTQDMDKFIEKTYEMLDALNMSDEAYKKMLEAPSTQIDMFTTNLKTAFAKASTDGINSLSPLINNLNNMLEGEKADRFFGIVGEGFTNVADLGGRAFNLINNNADSLLNTMENMVTVANVIGSGFMSTAEWIDENQKTLDKLIGTIGLITLNPIAAREIFPDPKEAGYKLAESFAYVRAGIKTIELSFQNLDVVALNSLDHIAISGNYLKLSMANQFTQMKIAGIRAFQDLANSVIDALNSISGFSNTILGTKFEEIDHIKIGTNSMYNTYMNSILDNLQTKVSMMERQSNINKRNEMHTEWTTGKNNIAKELAKQQNDIQRNINNYKNRFNPSGMNLTDTNNSIMTNLLNDKLVNPYLNGTASAAGGMNNNKDIGKVGSVGNVENINDTIDMTSEDLRYMREIAERESINQFTQQTLAPQITITFGDVRETADVSKIIDEISGKLQERLEISSNKVSFT